MPGTPQRDPNRQQKQLSVTVLNLLDDFSTLEQEAVVGKLSDCLKLQQHSYSG